jgi:hypothetical protein
MSVERYLVRLYCRSSKKTEREASLSLGNERRLRELLEEMVEDHVGETRMRRTDLSNGWMLKIHRVSARGSARGRPIAHVRVSKGGDTEVTT